MLCGTQAEVREERKKLTTRRPQKFYKQLLESEKIHPGKWQSADLSATTVHSPHLMLHAALERAVKEQLIPRNPTEACMAPKPQKSKCRFFPLKIYTLIWRQPKQETCFPELVRALQNGVDVKKKAHQTGVLPA